MIDLTRLDQYIIVHMGDKTLADYDDTRELEGEFSPGVHPLWSDKAQSIIAFAFEATTYTRPQADEWLAQFKRQPKSASAGADSGASASTPAQAQASAGLSLSDIVRAIADGIARAMGTSRTSRATPDGESEGTPAAPAQTPAPARALYSFDKLRVLLSQAVEERYPAESALPSPDSEPAVVRGGWLVDFGTEQAIVNVDGAMYVLPYTIYNGRAILGDPVPVQDDKRWVRSDGSPIYLHSLTIHLGDGSAALDGEGNGKANDGLVWKEVLHPGKWFKTNTGRAIEITRDIIASAFSAWKDGMPKLISVPADTHHGETSGVVPSEANRGFVERLKLVGDRLFAGFRFTDPQVGASVADGSIRDVSVYLQPNVVHPSTGKTYPWALRHILLTNDPLVQDLAPFGAIPASASGGAGYVVETYKQKEERMAENTEPVTPIVQDTAPATPAAAAETPAPAPALSAEDAQALADFRGLGLSVDAIKALVSGTRARARELEVTRIVRALEGVETHPGVAQVSGRRHYPVVCAAVETALKEQPAALALGADDNGQTQLDALVLSIVNAIPDEGRMALSTPPAGDKRPVAPVTDISQISDEQATAIADRLAKMV